MSNLRNNQGYSKLVGDAAIAAAFLALSAPVAVWAQAPTPPPAATTPALPTRTVRQIARGVELTQEITPDGSPNGPLVVTVLRVNVREKGVRIEAALGGDNVWGGDPTQGREIVSSLASRRGAVAGVNASFFPFAGNPIGLHIERGELVTEPTLKRSGFSVDAKGRAHIASWTYEGEVSRPGVSGDLSLTSRALSGLNRAPDKGDGLFLFTPRFWDRTLPAPGRFEVALTRINDAIAPGRTYTGIIGQTGENGGLAIAPRTVVLSGGGAGAEWLRNAVQAPGATKLTFSVSVTDTATGTEIKPGEIRDAIAGGPRLVRNGVVSVEIKNEGMGTAFSTTRHPRTALGVTANGDVLLLVVDGRQKGLSRGASLAETAALLLRFGAADGVNMDGGGSSAMTVRGGVANSPSEGVERPVADAFLVFADDATGNVATVSPTLASARPLLTGETRRFSPPPGWDARKTVWTTQGGMGFIAQDGLFHALRAGAGWLRASVGAGDNKTYRVPLTVVAAPAAAPPVLDAAGFAARLALVPDAVSPGAKATLVITIANAEGDPLGGETVAISVTGGKPDAASVTTNAKGEARVGVTWDAQTPVARRAVVVTSPAKRFNTGAIPLLPLRPATAPRR